MRQVAAAGQAMAEVEAPALLSDLLRSLNRSVVHNSSEPSTPRCWPYVAGGRACDKLPGAPSVRDSEPWRTYAEAMWAAALPQAVVADVVAFNRQHSRMMRLGLPAGDGSGCCGNQLQSFTSHGWGYGLLRNDLPSAHTLALFATSAHAQTRGTWTAPEEADIDGGGMPYCPPSQLAMPLFLKWAFVFEQPDDASLWLGRGAPRSLTLGAAAVGNVPTRFGRVGYALHCSASACAANITIPATWAVPGAWHSAPPGGLYLRVRPPGLVLANASLGATGAPLPVDRARQCVSFTASWLASSRAARLLEDVQLSFVSE